MVLNILGRLMLFWCMGRLGDMGADTGWTDPPIPEVIGHVEFTEEEKKENDRRMNEILRKYGIIK